MDETIQLLRKQPTTNPQLGRTSRWQTLDTVAADLLQSQGSESLQSGQVQARVAHRFRIRAFAGLTTQDRALWTPRWPDGAKAQQLEILAILPDPKDRGYHLLECATSDGALDIHG